MARARLRPTAFTTRVLNPLVRRTAWWDVHTLEVAGRRTGRSHRVPVVPVDVAGHLYLVSAYGGSDWVHDVRAAGRLTLTQHGRATAWTAVEVPFDQRAPVLRAWRRKGGWTVEIYFRRRPDPADHPVFRLAPAAAPGVSPR